MLWSAKEAIYKQISKKGVTLKGITMQPADQGNGAVVTMKGIAMVDNQPQEVVTNSLRIRNHVLSYCC
jgi:phosphopantetheinyl transferase (holo-ACP synthase)